jgi:hypothetical protein
LIFGLVWILIDSTPERVVWRIVGGIFLSDFAAILLKDAGFRFAKDWSSRQQMNWAFA